MQFLRKIICVLALAFLSQHVLAIPVKSVNVSGGCDGNYFLVVDVCVSNDALSTYTKEELMQLIFEYKGISNFGSAISSARTSRRICESKVSENEGDYFELRDGSVLKKTGYGYVGYIGYAKSSLLIIKSSNSGTLMIEDKSPFSVEILRAALSVTGRSNITIIHISR